MSTANQTCFVTGPPSSEAVACPIRNLLPPFLNPPVVQHRRDRSLSQDFDPRRAAIGLAVEHMRPARVGDELGAHHPRRVPPENDPLAPPAPGLHHRFP